MIIVKIGNIIKAVFKSGLLILWVWFCLRSVELVFQYKNGISPFHIDPWILAGIPILVIWFGITLFVVFKIIKVEF